VSSGDRLDAAIHAGAAAPNSLMGLHLKLKERLEAVAARFPLLETKGGARAPQVFDGWLPPRQNDADPFPFFLPRPVGGTDTEEGAEQYGSATVKIIVGTYSDTDDGWLDVQLLIDAIRTDILERPIIEGTAYQQTGALTWEIPEEQPRPQWFGTVTTIWTVPRPERVADRFPELED
jgi:hypothetical protein